MKSSASDLAKKLKVTKARGLEAIMKADLIDAVLRTVKRQGLSHSEIAAKSGLPRSAVTGILSGSLQKVTLDRILRLVEGVGLTARVSVRKSAA